MDPIIASTGHPGSLIWYSGVAVFLQVSIPWSLALRCVGLGGLSWMLTYAWEQLLRRSFTSPKPPRKGYEVHKHLLQAGKGAAKANGALPAHQHAD